MVERGWLVVVALTIGCGPAVVTPGDEQGNDSSSGPVSETDSPSTTIADSTVDPDPSTTIATTSPTSDATTSTTSDTSGDESSSGDPFECGCPPNVPIEFDDVLQRGFTPAEAIAQFDDAVLELEWLAYGEQPNTMLHVDVSYTGGAVEQGPGGSDGCLFLSAPCDEGLVMDVVLTVSTDDGWVIWTTPAQLTGIVGGELSVSSEYVSPGENTGSLATHQAYDRGLPRTVEAIAIGVSRFSFFDEWYTGAELSSRVAEDNGYYLQLATTPAIQ